ncbi:uncharacterized protein L201_007901 [Kwoniella dendrophila CBS 6074]|uniref:Zn(2)-C6 fungal-type domain-containing protein n=1 Tax=Kwoniella dendrophila CBS 6074 TaxID=1295534 RepID=A0AAX4K810_9TREE
MSTTNYSITPGGESSNSTSASSPYSPPFHTQSQHQNHSHINNHDLDYSNNNSSNHPSPHQLQPPQSSADKSQRSRDGCLTCRQRKVKCNEVRPICDKCRIKSRECLWPSGDESERRRNKKRRVTNASDDTGSNGENTTNNGVNTKNNGNHPPTHASTNSNHKKSSSNKGSGVELKPILPSRQSSHQSRSHSQSHQHLQPIQPSLPSPSSRNSVPPPLQPPPSHSMKLPPIQPYPPSHQHSYSHKDTHYRNHNNYDNDRMITSPANSASASRTLNPSNLRQLQPLPSSSPILPSPTTFNYHRQLHQTKTTVPIRRVKGAIHIPPGFLPPDAITLAGINGKTRNPNDGLTGDLVDWLVPEKARAAMMMDPSFLEPYFPTVDERLVMRHYLSKTVHIILAFESNHHPWNPWISIHAELAFKHPPGTNPAADALRSAILAVGGVHLAYSTDPTNQAAAWKITKSAKIKVLDLIRQTLEDKDGNPKVLEKENIELILAALLSCTISSSLAADDSWHDLLSSVLSLIDQLGGAHNILQDAPRDRLSPSRFFMEQLAIRDVFGCMTTELAPSILQDAFTPWFFEAESWSRSDFEWESVERMFGISRGMVDMIARACNLIASVRASNQHLPEGPLSAHSVDPSMIRLQKASSELMAELKIWDEAENFTPLHPRTQYGNHSYKHAIRIRMLRKVYNIPSEDERVIKSSQAIIELAGEMLALYGKITWLTWPILIAGFEIPPSHPSRRTALEMLGAFGPHACFDNRAAARMLSDYWMWHDMDGDHATSWEVARTLNQRPFLD